MNMKAKLKENSLKELHFKIINKRSKIKLEMKF